jgi:hypothetical protein
MTNSFYSFAQTLRAEFEGKIKAELSRSLLLLAFLPLTINITTNQGNGRLTILKNGSIQLNQNLSSNPDNAVNADFETLKELYRSRDRNQFKKAENEGKIGISSYTMKGKMAETKIREFLGC